jgi:hypothetical protein
LIYFTPVSSSVVRGVASHSPVAQSVERLTVNEPARGEDNTTKSHASAYSGTLNAPRLHSSRFPEIPRSSPWISQRYSQQAAARVIIAVAGLLIIVFCPGYVWAATQSLDSRKQTLDIIASFAERICPSVPTSGGSSSVDVEAKAKAELPRLVKQLAELGVKGAARYQSSQYQGVLQKDLGPALRDTANCRTKIVDSLFPRFFPPDSGTDRAQEQREVRQRHLTRLQHVLRGDASNLKKAAELLRSYGFVVGAGLKAEPERDEMLSRYFVFDEVLDSDLVNHFRVYVEHKSALRKAIQKQDADYLAAVSLVLSAVPDAIMEEPDRMTVATAVVAQCLGTGALALVISDNGWQWSAPYSGSTGGRGKPDRRYVVMNDAYSNLKSDDKIRPHCERIKSNMVPLSDRATALMREALESADRQLLTGSCKYLR